MKKRLRLALKVVGGGLLLLLAGGLAAPYFTADQYGERLRWSLERALGRRVELGRVRFSLLKGPAFTVDSVTIHEDPSLGLEPVVYLQDPGSVTVAPRLWSLLGGKFVIASISLDGASINLAKSGPASEPGRWNFASLVNRSVMRNPLALHVRNSRVNFRFGDTKSGFYLTGTDLDISPPGPGGTAWTVRCSAQPARTDRSGLGLGSFKLNGRWYLAPDRVDLDLAVERARVAELTALVRGYAGEVHGTVTSHLHLGGPIDNIGIQGRLNVQDVHRWDLMPPHGEGWPLDVRGRLDLLHQELEVQSSTTGAGTLPLAIRFRASDYLTQPRWGVALNWDRFPVEPLMQLAAHMGAQFPPRLKLSGSINGAIGYSSHSGLQGELAFHDAAVEIPDSPPVHMDQAYVVLDRGHIRLTPALVRSNQQDQAQVEADYSMDERSLDLSIHAESLTVESLRAQVSLAAVPWLEQVTSGQWGGTLRYHYQPDAAGWTGQLEVRDARIPIEGLAHPLELVSARAQIDGAKVLLDRMEASAGDVRFRGDYRYDPTAARPHRVRLRAASVDAAQLEAELMPTLRRSSNIFARALGRASLPAWIKDRSVEGSVQADEVLLAGARLRNVRARLLWDGSRLEFDQLQAVVEEGALSGRLAVNLRADRPAYRLTGKLKGVSWQSGKIDAEGAISSSGTGAQLLANLTSEGAFSGAALDFGTPAPWRNVSGTYSLAWAPRLRFTGLNLKMEDETYTGRGTVQEDGRMLVVLSNGAKEMRMSGTFARMRLEEGLIRP